MHKVLDRVADSRHSLVMPAATRTEKIAAMISHVVALAGAITALVIVL